MDINKALSLFLMWLEIWGYLYFFNTFLQRRIGKLQKYQFIIWFVCVQIWAVAGEWIGWWKVIPILLAHTILCLLFYQIPLWQSFFFSLLNYGLMVMIEYLSLLVLDRRWLLPTRDDKMILSIKNPVREKAEIVDNIVQKEHGSGHGIGLLNVKSVVEQYDGDLALACDEKEFRAVVIL